MIAILETARRIGAHGLQMRFRIGSIADVDIGGRHGERSQPREFAGTTDHGAGGAAKAKTLAAPHAAHGQGVGTDDDKSLFGRKGGDEF